MSGSRLRIDEPVVRRSEAGWRLSAEVLGEPLWFSSRDRALEPAPEAFGSALLIPALRSRRRLALESAVSPLWLSNVTRLLEVLEEWWGYPRLAPAARPGTARVASPPRRTALCFGGGVDSLYALLAGHERPDMLVFVVGYDIAVSDRPRAAAAERSMREVASATGTEAVVVESNLREHPAHTQANWEHGHGGALAAVGHALRGVGRLLIAAAYPHDLEHWGWGTHSRIDPLWSSEALRVATAGADAWRWEKVRMLAGQPIAHRHLRVCWEHRSDRLNCSRCEKCVRTMLELAACGKLADFEVFDPPAPLHDLVDDVPGITRTMSDIYADIIERTTDRRLRRALRRLMARSGLPDRSSRSERFRRRFQGKSTGGRNAGPESSTAV